MPSREQRSSERSLWLSCDLAWWPPRQRGLLLLQLSLIWYSLYHSSPQQKRRRSIQMLINSISEPSWTILTWTWRALALLRFDRLILSSPPTPQILLWLHRSPCRKPAAAPLGPWQPALDIKRWWLCFSLFGLTRTRRSIHHLLTCNLTLWIALPIKMWSPKEQEAAWENKRRKKRRKSDFSNGLLSSHWNQTSRTSSPSLAINGILDIQSWFSLFNYMGMPLFRTAIPPTNNSVRDLKQDQPQWSFFACF